MFLRRLKHYGGSKMIEIRKYESKDKAFLRKICLETSAFDVNEKNMEELNVLADKMI